MVWYQQNSGLLAAYRNHLLLVVACAISSPLTADFRFCVPSSRDAHAILQYEDQVSDHGDDDEEDEDDEEDGYVLLHHLGGLFV